MPTLCLKTPIILAQHAVHSYPCSSFACNNGRLMRKHTESTKTIRPLPATTHDNTSRAHPNCFWRTRGTQQRSLNCWRHHLGGHVFALGKSDVEHCSSPHPKWQRKAIRWGDAPVSQHISHWYQLAMVCSLENSLCQKARLNSHPFCWRKFNSVVAMYRMTTITHPCSLTACSAKMTNKYGGH